MRGIGGSIGLIRSVLIVVAVMALSALGSTCAVASSSTSLSSSLLGNPLVVPTAEPFVGGQQVAAAVAKRANPLAALARERSRTEYSHLAPSTVTRLLGRAFPWVVTHPAGGTPALPAGTHLVGYPTTHSMQIALPKHQLGIVESAMPLAKRSNGRLQPVDLSLRQNGAGYAPTVTTVPVEIPRELSAGVSLEASHVALIPVDANGRPLSGSSTFGRASVVYPNTGPATDTIAKPTQAGFQLDAALRSARSPQRLYYRVSAPHGAKLVQDRASGSVRVVKTGETIATIMAPGSQDSAETAVPTSMSFVGHTLVITVAHRSGSYLYPIDVDPEIVDKQLVSIPGGKPTRWKFEATNLTHFAGTAVYEGVEKEHLETKGIAPYGTSEVAFWGYETKGKSKIYELKAETEAKNIAGSKIESFVELQEPGGAKEEKELLSTEANLTYARKPLPEPLCPKGKETCVPTAGHEKNAVHFQQSATAGSGSNYGFSDTMFEGVVSISEPAGTHSTTIYNTTSPELEFEVSGKTVKRKNALYGSGTWLSNFEGALKMTAEDTGIGVAATKLEYESAPSTWTQLSKHEYLEKENLCEGIQCFASHSEYWTLDPKLPDGEQNIRYRAEEAMSGTTSLESEGKATVKVDATKPRSLGISGLPFGNELSEKPYELVAQAIDGQGSTVASSGVKSLALYVDGTQFGTSGGSCSVAKGECTASRTWTINGAELGAGHHAIVLIVFDNAGNEARLERTLSIRHSTPVAIGPGSVDLQSGDFTLGATDVSMGSGLTVARTYSSRGVVPGSAEPLGALGPQWGLSLGSTESLRELVDGGVLLTAGNGGQTIFAPLGGGKFESPAGDSNLKLSLEENSETKEKLAYYLKDEAKHTSVKFARSSTVSPWVPVKQEGTAASDTVTYSYETSEPRVKYTLPTETRPQGVTVGSDGNIWTTLRETGKIARVTPYGKITEFAAETTEPNAITTGPDGNVWYTTSGLNKFIYKMTPSGSVTKYEINHKASAITTGPDGKIWYVDYVNDRVGKMGTSGGGWTEYALPAGSKPNGITAGAEGNLWVSEYGTNKLAEITTSGTITQIALAAESKPQSITRGPDSNIWFTEAPLKKLGKVVPATGAITEYSIASTTGWMNSLVAGSNGKLWFVDNGAHKLWEVTTSGTANSYGIPESEISAVIAGPDGNPWYSDAYPSFIGSAPIGGKSVKPTQVLAPKPTGVSCEPELKEGCRALKLQYGSTTTATGENSSEWGSYQLRLSKVLLDAYDPVAKKMTEVSVAEYTYDNRGRLRAEWDPRISPALKTDYGYDEEGHLTALAPPGQESWGFTYGMIPGDAGKGRLLKVARASASTSLWGGESVKNTSAPSGLPGLVATKVRVKVTNGSWSGSPFTYGYQWEDCNSSGAECSPIAGANNANYTPKTNDVGHTLVAMVTATNGGGSASVSSPASGVVVTGSEQTLLSSGNSMNAVTCVPSTTDCVASDSKGNAFYTTNISTSEGATWTSWSGPGTKPSEALSCPTTSLCLIAAGEKSGVGGNLYYATSLGGSWSTATSPSYGVDAISCASSSMCVEGQNNFGYFRYATNPGSTSWTLESQGSAAMKGVFCLSSSFCAIVDSAGAIHVATSTAQIESSTWTETKVDGTVALNSVSCTSTTSCVAVDTEGFGLSLTIGAGGEATVAKRTEVTYGAGRALPSVACPTSTECVTVDSQGNTFTSTNSGSTWTLKYHFGGLVFTSVSCPSAALCVVSDTSGKVTAFNPTTNGLGLSEAEAVSPQLGMAVEYGVPLSGGSELQNMTAAEVAKWGQEDDPVEATAILPFDAQQGWPATSYKRAMTYYLDEQGRTVNASSPSTASHGAVTTSEYNELNDLVRTLSADNRQTALEAGSESMSVATQLSTYFTYREECSKESEGKEETESSEPGSRLCETEGPRHEIKYIEGGTHKEALARLHTKYFYDEKAPGGETYNLKTKTVTIAELSNEAKEEVEGRVTKISYSGQSNLGWKLRAPTSVTIDPEGKKITTTTLYNSTTGQITETRGALGGGGESARDTKFIYYSAEANTEGYSSCGSHPAWAGLVCETLPAKQPEVGTPAVPVVVATAYNIWNEPETVTETFGSTTRTKTNTYDSAGRLSTSETTSSANVALPKVTNEYNSKTGILEKQSTTVEAKTKTLTSKYNTLGQMTEYTDTDGNTSKYTYGGPENDFLLEEVTDGSGEGTGRQVYSYNSTTKALEKLLDSAAGTFTASYDAEGKLTSEVYPNAMCAKEAYNSAGEAINLEYIKTSNCSESGAPVWYSETRGLSVRGETYDRASTLANESYFYDSVGRLTEAQETPAGEGCSERLYAYDDESNRTSQTTRVPGGAGKCATEGGTVLSHSYDEANRLKDSGVTYDVFGNVTKLPAADAEGHELASTFYVDNAVATQSQNGVSKSFYMDPEGRLRETVTGGTTAISHYDGPGGAVAWTSEGSGKGTRSIPGVDGGLAATQTNGEAAILQLRDLQGNIVATASLSTEATKVLSTYNSTEFGVPNAEKAPPKFAWIGSGGVASTFSSGVITYGSTSYVPQTGMSLQSEEVEPPGLPGGSGGGAAYTSQMEPWNMQGAAREGAEAPGLEAAREQAAWEAAWAAATDPPQVHYMNKTKARGLAEKLWYLSKAAEVADALDVPLDWVEAAVGVAGKIAVSTAVDWLVRTSEMMWKCGNSKWSIVGVKANICKLEYSVLDVAGTDLVNFTKRANVFVCMDNSGKTCFHQVFPDPPPEEVKCAFGIFCIAVAF